MHQCPVLREIMAVYVGETGHVPRSPATAAYVEAFEYGETSFVPLLWYESGLSCQTTGELTLSKGLCGDADYEQIGPIKVISIM